MKPLSLLFLQFCLCASGMACAPSLDVPPAPELEPLLEAYEDPNVNVRSEIMAEWADEIEQLYEDIENTSILDEILEVIISVQEELDEATDEQGNLELDGVKFPSPNGAIAIDYICTGWGDTETTDPANGTIELTMTLAGGSIGPIVWGVADRCRYLETVTGEEHKSFFDGGIAVHFGEFVSTSKPIRELLITFLLEGTIGFDGEEFRIKQSFRIAESGRLDILVQINDNEAFIFFFDGESFAQGVNDATGIFGCSLDDRCCSLELEDGECTDASGSTFFW